jgi:hypothetical protein
MPRKTLTLLGLLLVFNELAGLPNNWKITFGVLVGVIIVFIAFRTGDILPEPEPAADAESSFKKVMTEEDKTAYAEVKQD